MTTLTLEHVGQLKDARIVFGDLTVLVGPQASGKSIALQWLKLLLDADAIQEQLRQYGYEWSGSLAEFMNIYFGEGMSDLWRDGESAVLLNGKRIEPVRLISRMQKNKKESLYFVPAQRVLTLRDGWPRPFSDYQPGDPYVVRAFSERFRLMMEKCSAESNCQPFFPRKQRVGCVYHKQLQDNIFGDYQLEVDKVYSRKRFVLRRPSGQDALPYMVWSSGQREFVPLLMGLYWLLPSQGGGRRDDLTWAVIEEPEMGLHPRAISVVLLMVMELLSRGYRVCLSTHSPQILELVWVLHTLHREKADPRMILEMFGITDIDSSNGLAESLMSKKIKVHYFDRESGRVADITKLDFSSQQEQSWGGLMDFSALANDVVARAVAGARA